MTKQSSATEPARMPEVFSISNCSGDKAWPNLKAINGNTRSVRMSSEAVLIIGKILFCLARPVREWKV